MKKFVVGQSIKVRKLLAFFSKHRSGTAEENRLLQREVAIRDEVIQTLCFRYIIRCHEDGGWKRAAIFAEKYLNQSRQGTLDTALIPPSQKLLLSLEKAYYQLPGRISMCHMNDRPLSENVLKDSIVAAQLVANQEQPGIASRC
jgi:hypothetical protein